MQGGYVGSYCMDAMAMAFYRCYHSADYTDAVSSSSYPVMFL